MARKSEIREAIWLIVRCLAPYADPVARRRSRAAAKRLVECSPWPGEDADGFQIAQLALMRLMWLQREAHRAARAAHLESVALLARTAIETCIVGLYCLVDTDAPTKLNDQNAHHLDTNSSRAGIAVAADVLAVLPVANRRSRRDRLLHTRLSGQDPRPGNPSLRR